MQLFLPRPGPSSLRLMFGDLQIRQGHRAVVGLVAKAITFVPFLRMLGEIETLDTVFPKAV